MAANSNWYNAHNFYGDLTDIEAAKLDEVKKFFATFYAPNNAALAIVGDFDNAEAKNSSRNISALSRRRGSAPARSVRTASGNREANHKTDPLAPRPALAIGYHMPDRNTPDTTPWACSSRCLSKATMRCFTRNWRRSGA